MTLRRQSISQITSNLVNDSINSKFTRKVSIMVGDLISSQPNFDQKMQSTQESNSDSGSESDQSHENEVTDLQDKIYEVSQRRMSEKDTKKQIQNRLKEFLKEKEEKIIIKTKDPSFFKLTEKMTFYRSVMIVLTSLFLIGRDPTVGFIRFYTYLTIYLLFSRLITLRLVKQHYFFLEFCYWGNAILIIYLQYFSLSKEFWYIAFAGNSGIMAFAIVGVNNALIFHDHGQMASLFIHSGPAIVTYILRWNHQINDKSVTFQFYDSSVEQFSFQQCYEMLFYFFIFYFMWQVLYSAIIFFVAYDRILTNVNTKGYRTMYHDSMKSLQKYNPKLRPFVFMGGHFIMTFILTLWAVFALYWNFYLHTLYLFVLISFSILNAANFYIEKFEFVHKKKIDKLRKESGEEIKQE